MLDNYDVQLRIRSIVPDFDGFVDRYRARSVETRRLVRSRLDVAYGPSELERLDVFLPNSDRTDAPVHVFFHGGYWRAFDKSDYSYIARSIVDAGAIAIIANYGLMPGVSMAELLSQCRSVIRWVHTQAASIGGSPHRISVSGHSAGGHIASVLHLTSWEDYGLPVDVIKTTVSVSGIYDLGPIHKSFLQGETGLTAEDVKGFSPISWPSIWPIFGAESSGKTSSGRLARPLVISVGADETPEMKRQAEAFSTVLRDRGAAVELRVETGRHHMNIVLDIGDPRSPLGRVFLGQVLSAGG